MTNLTDEHPGDTPLARVLRDSIANVKARKPRPDVGQLAPGKYVDRPEMERRQKAARRDLEMPLHNLDVAGLERRLSYYEAVRLHHPRGSGTRVAATVAGDAIRSELARRRRAAKGA